MTHIMKIMSSLLVVVKSHLFPQFVARAGLSTYAVYGRRSHKMKQTQTHVWSLAGRRGSIVLAGERKGSSSHSGEWRGSGVLSGASSLLHLGRAAEGQWENTETAAKLPQPAQPSYHARGARPEDHVITNY